MSEWQYPLPACRVLADPNGLFCCGDPCQTIAQGVAFRFADICTMFHKESERRRVRLSATGLPVQRQAICVQ